MCTFWIIISVMDCLCLLQTHVESSTRGGFSVITCGEHHVLRDEFVIHDGELGQFNLVHPCHGVVASSPVELNVVCSVTV